MNENAHGTTTRAQLRQAHAPATQILRACAVEMHIDDVERHECAVHSSELAVHARTLQRSKHQLPFPYRKNPSVCPHCLGNQEKEGKNEFKVSRSTIQLLLSDWHDMESSYWFDSVCWMKTHAFERGIPAVPRCLAVLKNK